MLANPRSIYCCATTTLHSALTPFEAVAVITASPSATPVTVPSPSTVATVASDELYVNDLSSASSGVTLALRENDLSGEMIIEDGMMISST